MRPALRMVLCTVSLLLATMLFPSLARADNPIVQTIYTADPAPLVHNGRVYVYTGHDEDGSTYFTSTSPEGRTSSTTTAART